MTVQHPLCDGRAGFTLVETLLVVLILALVAALVAPAVGRRSPQVRVEADAARVAGALRMTRAAAMSRSEEMRVFIDVNRRTVASPVFPRTQLDPDLQIGMMFAAQERRAGTRGGGVLFFPNGQSTGGEIVLRLGAAQTRVVVNWATGHAELSR